MMAENSRVKTVMIVSIGILAILIFGIVWLINRNKPFLNTILWYIVALMIFAVIGGIVWLVVWLFKKKRIDLLYVAKTQILETCEINKPDEKVPIYLYDKKNTRLVGTFLGYTMIKSADWIASIDPNNQEEVTFFKNMISVKPDKVSEDYLYIIGFKTSRGRKEMLLVRPDDINNIDANPIYVYDQGLSPKLYEFHYLSKYYDIGNIVEMPIKGLMLKYTIEHNLREMVNVVDNAMDIDAQFRKDQERSNIEEFRPREEKR